MELYNYTAFVYQKFNPNEPNYMPHNRGTEGAVYLQYVVDHYDNFPDVALFVQADGAHFRQDTYGHVIDIMKCVQPNVTYSSVRNYVCMTRDSHTKQW